MPKLTIIVGMAGSGKSHLLSEISKSGGVPMENCFPDATLAQENKHRAGFKRLPEIVARLLGNNEDCVMDEAHLADPEFQRYFRGFMDEFLRDVDQHWIFFKHDVVACINNLYRDAERGVHTGYDRFKALDNQRKVYRVPGKAEWSGESGVTTIEFLPVHNSVNSRFAQADKTDAIDWLQSEIKRLSPSKHS